MYEVFGEIKGLMALSIYDYVKNNNWLSVPNYLSNLNLMQGKVSPLPD